MSVFWRLLLLFILVSVPFLSGCGSATTSESSARQEAERAAAQEAENPEPPDD